MAIDNNDRFLVNRGGQSFYVSASNLPSKSFDWALVNRKYKDGVYDSTGVYESRKATKSQMLNDLRSDDLLLVDRSGQSFKCTGTDILNYFDDSSIPGTGIQYWTNTRNGTNGQNVPDMFNGGELSASNVLWAANNVTSVLEFEKPFKPNGQTVRIEYRGRGDFNTNGCYVNFGVNLGGSGTSNDSNNFAYTSSNERFYEWTFSGVNTINNFYCSYASGDQTDLECRVARWSIGGVWITQDTIPNFQ